MKFVDLTPDQQELMARRTMQHKGQALARDWLKEQDEQTIRDLLDGVDAELEQRKKK